MASPPGTKGDHKGDLAVGDVVAWMVAALSATALLPMGQAPQRMPQEPRWDWGGEEVFHEKRIVACHLKIFLCHL